MSQSNSKAAVWIGVILLMLCHPEPGRAAPGLERISVASNGLGFVCLPSRQVFHPWGNNYGNGGRLIEDFWDRDWSTVAADFQEMKRMGANVVRIHLQFGKFMRGPDQLNPDALAQLSRLLGLAEKTGLYLDLTGLACYRKADVPAWYDSLVEAARWAAQARFWEGVAAQCANSPAVFCYDLINEPIVAGGVRKPGDWYTGELGGLNFIQFINLHQAGRPREKIAGQWVKVMAAAIHQRDRQHLVTVGMIPPPKGWGSFSAFEPKLLAPELDFISVHIYPEKGQEEEALKVLRHYAVGKPVVIEETFPLSCPAAELKTFLLDSRGDARGWIGHYNGEPIPRLEALQKSGKITAAQSAWLSWQQLFVQIGPSMNGH
jgi:hypothetical protein